MEDTSGSQPATRPPYLVRCPSCHEWFEATDLVRSVEKPDGSTTDRCPRDATVLERPALRPPPPLPLTARDHAEGCLFIPYLSFMVGWPFVGLPLLAGAVLVLYLTANAVPLVAWVVVTIVY